MKIGYNEATMMKNSTLVQDLELTERLGYDYIEIRLDMLKKYLKERTLNDLKSFFQQSHVKPYALNAIEPINFFEGAGLKRLEEQVESACKVAMEINNPYIVVVPSIGNIVSNYTYKEINEDSVRILNILADIAEQYHSKLAFEPIGMKNCAVRSIRQASEIIDAVNRESVGIVLDVFNLFLFDELKSYEDVNLLEPEKVFVFHINDAPGMPIDQLDHCHRLMPGDGVAGKMVPLLQILNEKQYDGIVSIELFNPLYWNMQAENVLRIGKEKIEKVLEKIR